MRDLAAKLVLLLCSSVVTVYAVNAIAHVWFPVVSPAEMSLEARRGAAEQRGIEFDSRTPLEVLEEIRAEGAAAYPMMTGIGQGSSSRASGLLPLGGVPQVPTVFCNESGSYVTYMSDPFGFRNPPTAWESRPVDIVLVGDSFAHGYCVEDTRDIAGVLRRGGQRVVNLGMSGNGPLLNLASIVEYGQHLEPRRVYWLHYERNDLRDLQHERRFPLLLEYLQPGWSQNLYSRKDEVERYLRERAVEVVRRAADDKEQRQESGRSTLDNLVRLLKLTNLRLRLAQLRYTPERCGSFDPMFTEVLERARQTVSSWDGELVLVYLPAYRRFYYPSTESDYCFHDRILSIADDLQIDVVDITEVFARHEDPLGLFPFRVTGHYTSEGYGLVAQAILAHADGKPE